MKFIDFFSGVGGFTRGLELAGHECIGHCEFDKFAEASYRSMHTITEEQRARLGELDKKKRQKEILKDGYLNGEWYARDVRAVNSTNIPRADCWTFGAPCQDFSIAGRRAGLDGERSSLVREIFRILEELEEEDKPTWIIYENVKGMLSSNRGLDFLSIVVEMDRLGYDLEWQNINSRWFVLQNRERIYVVGCYRGRSRRQIFPITGNGGENSTRQLIGGAQAHRVYDSNGIACTQNAQAGGVGAKTGLYAFGVDKSSNKLQELQIANCLTTKDRGVSNRRKEAGEDMFTLTTQDQHGIAIKADEEKDVWAVWSEKYNCYLTIRKLTPRESFRLQGWTDNYYEKAEFVNSDSQLYKQAGNGVTIGIVKAIGEKLWTKENL